MSGPEGWSAVTSAADLGQVDLLRMMAEAGVPVHWADGHGWLALHVAVFQGRSVYEHHAGRYNAKRFNLLSLWKAGRQ